jgi:hypothetical protein
MSSRYLDLAKQALAERRQAKGGCRVLGGKTVAEVVRESARAVWFRDEHGAAWRYVYSWGIAAPVGGSGRDYVQSAKGDSSGEAS